MPNLSGLKQEITSVNDIKKITGAMELVATAKLKRIAKRASKVQNYVTEVYNMFNSIIQNSDRSFYLKNNNEKFEKTLWIVVNSNLGLCGGYNANINKLTLKNLKSKDEIFAIGGKAFSFFSSRNINIRNKVLNVDVDFTNNQAAQIGNEILSMFSNSEFDEIKLVYTKFINNVTFEPTILRLFPIIKEENEKDKTQQAVASFEPDPETILKHSVSLYLNTIIFGTILESQLSEQASRRMAMEAANKNGKDLSASLSVIYNRKRQDSITQEITEIVGGANAQNG